MNSKSEWGGSRIPRLTLEVGERVHQEEYRGKGQASRKLHQPADRKAQERKGNQLERVTVQTNPQADSKVTSILQGESNEEGEEGKKTNQPAGRSAETKSKKRGRDPQQGEPGKENGRKMEYDETKPPECKRSKQTGNPSTPAKLKEWVRIRSSECIDTAQPVKRQISLNTWLLKQSGQWSQ